jgi:flagellar basal body rod protein FlgG
MSAGMMQANAAGQPFLQPRASSTVNFQPGQMHPTGGATDVAIEGKGFFEVQLPNGASAFTRDGEFHFNAQGQLVTKSGYAVMGEGGPVQLDPSNHAPISISDTGEIQQGAEVRGKLRVVEFNDPQLLTPISGAYFMANNPGVQATTAAKPQLHAGYVEGSNTSPLATMTHLITAMRMTEANQKVIQTHDDRMHRALTELGNLS